MVWFKKNKPPVDLYLISEKSIWKNQVRQTGFLVYFKLNFYCLCDLQRVFLPGGLTTIAIWEWIFTACVTCKNQFRNWFLQVKNPVHRTWFFKLDFSKIKYRWIGREVFSLWDVEKGDPTFDLGMCEIYFCAALYLQSRPTSVPLTRLYLYKGLYQSCRYQVQKL